MSKDTFGREIHDWPLTDDEKQVMFNALWQYLFECQETSAMQSLQRMDVAKAILGG
jgi:hypothetical protein